MVLINTDGMALIGPGSEWLWTAVSGVVLAVTFVAIYRQLSLRRSAAAIEQHLRLVSQWESEPMLSSRIALLTSYRDRAAFDNPSQEAEQIGNIWDGVGYLVRSGHVDRRLVHNNFGNGIQVWWTLLNPMLVSFRAEANDLETWEEFEWLAHHIAQLDRKAGRNHDFGEAYIRRNVSEVIEVNTQQLRKAEAMRAVILAPAPKAGGRQRHASTAGDRV